MYKIIILDLDGTLLNSKQEISEVNKQALHASKAKIVLASARGYYRIEPYVKALGIDNAENYTIAYNGSVILDNTANKVIDNCIPKEKLSLLKEYYKKTPEYKWAFYTNEKTYTMDKIDDLDEFLEKNTIYKVVFDTTVENVQKERENLSEELKENFEITSSVVYRIEFVKKGMTKTKAIQQLIDTLQIKQEEVIAMGDGENDINMIRFAGCGVAMGNATEKVKEAADLITLTNDEDGVAKAVEQLFNL